MKKSLLTFLVCLIISPIFAQDYLISFAGDGASSTVDSVKVENLTQGKNLTIPGNQLVHLKVNVTGVNPVNQNQLGGLKFSPNPMNESTLMEFGLPEQGVAQIEICDITGRIIFGKNFYLSQGRHVCQISRLGSGVYIVKIKSPGNSCSGKFVSNNPGILEPEIVYSQNLSSEEAPEVLKSSASEVLMQYNNGDRLKFTGFSGKYKTVVTDVATGSKSISFTFIPCTDAGGKDYSVVKIGTQWWMAENLAYLPAVYPTSSGTSNEPRYYVYGYEGTDVAAAKNQVNYATYGVLYNWPAAMATCPQGWHLPSDAEWKQLEMALGMTKSQADSLSWRGTNQGIQMKTTIGWHNNGNGTNTSGFSGLPGGFREVSGYIQDIGGQGYWWSSSESTYKVSFYRALSYYYNTTVYRGANPNSFGYSVRCIKD